MAKIVTCSPVTSVAARHTRAEARAASARAAWPGVAVLAELAHLA